MPNYSGIYENLVFDEVTGKWSEPERGAKYLVSRSATGISGRVRQERKSFATFAEAKAFRNRTLPETQVPKVETAAGMTVSQLIDEWKQNCLPHLQLTTQFRYQSYLKHFELLKPMRVEALQPTDIDRWITQLKQPQYLRGYHPTRCDYRHEFSVLRGILNYYATRKNRNYRLPFLKDHKAMLKVKDKVLIEKDLSVHQFKGVIAAIRADVMGTNHEVIFYVAMMQYLIYGRVQDAAALQYESFDFGTNKIRITKKVQWIRAKGYEDRIVDGSKTNGGKEIEMSALAGQLFREWVLKSGVRSGLLFRLEGRIIPYRAIEYRYTKALRKLGLPFRATHILRHASLTEYYQGCKDLLATAKVAGHDDLRSTEKYAKVRDESLVKNQRNMDDKLSGFFASSES